MGLKKLGVMLSIVFLKLVLVIASVNADWTASVLDGICGVVGQYTSIAVGSSGASYISYYDNTNGNLIYIVGSATTAVVTPTPTPTPSSGGEKLEIRSTNPLNGAVNVGINTTVSATFSMNMDSSSLNTNTFKLSSAGGAVAGSVVTNSKIATFTPSGSLLYNTKYTAVITTGARASSGNVSLNQDYSWSFTTEADTVPPTVISTTPSNNATAVAVNTKITAVFSETMDVSTITANTFIVSNGTSNIAGNVTSSGNTATFSPAGDLDYNKTYTATLTSIVKDTAGNALKDSLYTWSFTTIASSIGTPTPTATPTPTPTPAETGNITGQVTDADTGSPIAGAAVVLDVPTNNTTTNASGVYAFTGVSVASHTVASVATGYTQNTASVSASDFVSVGGQLVATADIELTATAPVTCDVATSIQTSPSGEMTIVKGTEDTITVAVRGDNNCAVSGVKVKASSNDTSKVKVSPSSATTNANGLATFTVKGKKKGSAKVTFKESTANLKAKVKVTVTK